MDKHKRKILPFNDLEQVLQNALSPVSPNPEFVVDLRTKLAKSPAIMLEKHPVHTTIYLIFAFGLFIGVFIFWLIRLIVRTRQSRIPEETAAA